MAEVSEQKSAVPARQKWQDAIRQLRIQLRILSALHPFNGQDGPPCIHLRFNTERLDKRKWRLIVQVMECHNLPPMDSNGLADPYMYVKLYLSENKDATKQKSGRRERTINPTFNETFFFDVSDADRMKHVHIEVWDYKRLRKNKVIGCTSVEISDVISDAQVDQWYTLLEDTRSKRIISGEEAHEKPKMTLNDFELKEILGRGSFGKVFRAEHKVSKEVYAIKSVKKMGLIEEGIEYLFNEKKVLCLQGKPQFFPALHYCFQSHDHLFFVMELINGGDLSHHLMVLGRFSEGQTRFYAAETVLGLMYLHSRGIVYRDLKPSNVMLDHEGHIRIVDFGLCKDGITAANKAHTFCGTPEYMAPEIISCQPYDTSVDWWALGVMIFEMIVGRPPFNGDDDERLFQNILKKSVRYPLGMTQHSVSIIEGFLHKNPVERLGCRKNGHDYEDIKSHKFFKMIIWERLKDRQMKPPYRPKIKNKSMLHLKRKNVALSNVEDCTVPAFEGFTYISQDM